MNPSSSDDMNTDVLPEGVPRYVELAKPKERVDRSERYNAFEVKRGALSYEISDRLNKLAQPKHFPTTDPLGSRSLSHALEKPAQRKLINSSQISRDSQLPHKKKFLLDTYARITAARNKKCSKRLLDLARPKHIKMAKTDSQMPEYDNFFRTIKKYEPASTSAMSSYKWD